MNTLEDFFKNQTTDEMWYCLIEGKIFICNSTANHGKTGWASKQACMSAFYNSDYWLVKLKEEKKLVYPKDFNRLYDYHLDEQAKKNLKKKLFDTNIVQFKVLKIKKED